MPKVEVLAQRIKQLRVELGLSNEKLAQALGASHKTVITWEKDRGDPSITYLLALARLFDVTPDYLLGMTDERGSMNGAGAASGQPAARSDASDEVAVEGDARTADRRPKRERRGSARRPES